jgi:hypothetical protein
MNRLLLQRRMLYVHNVWHGRLQVGCRASSSSGRRLGTWWYQHNPAAAVASNFTWFMQRHIEMRPYSGSNNLNNNNLNNNNLNNNNNNVNNGSHCNMPKGHILHPMGWDAFGLPAENAAVAHQVDPATWTRNNIATMKQQLQMISTTFDWDAEVRAMLPVPTNIDC